jgi:monofunctional glycosyltransferase
MRKILLIFVCCAGFYFLLFQVFKILTDVGALENSYPKVIYDAKTKTDRIEVVNKRPPNWVSLSSVRPVAVAAIVLSEDWAFYQHNGFDWEQIWDAMQKNMRTGRFARGGSTITQQVVKNVFLSNDKTLWRKAQEAVLAMRIERQLTKKRILEIYLNIAEMGQGIYGVGPAARHYFGKHPSELTAKEGAFLAMLLPSPVKYSVSFRKKALTPYAASTVRNILGKLRATNRISPEEYAAAMATPFGFEATQIPEPAVAPEDEEEEEVISTDQVEPMEEPAPEPAV